MHSCPHCRARSISSFRKLTGSTFRPIRCPECGGLAYLSGWGIAAADLAFQTVLFATILLVVIAQGWIALFLVPASIVAYGVMVDVFVPLKPITARDAVRTKKDVFLLMIIVIGALAAMAAVVSCALVFR
jgi:hypothetical protein